MHNLSYDEIVVALGYVPAKGSELVTVKGTTDGLAEAIQNTVTTVTNIATGIVSTANEITTLTTNLIDNSSNLFASGTALGEILSTTKVYSSDINTLQQTVTHLGSTLSNDITNTNLAIGSVDQRLTSTITNVNGQIEVINNTITSLVSGIGINDVIFYQSTAPSTGMVLNDMWINPSDNNSMHLWNGTSWITTNNTSFATIAALSTESNTRATNDSANSTAITSLYNQVNNVTTGLPATAAALNALSTNVTTNYALASSVTTLSSTVNAKNRIYYQSLAPVSGMILNDIWISLSDSKYYIYNGSTWISTDTITATGVAALVNSEASTRASADSAQANAILGISTTLNGSTTAISQALTSIDGIKGKYTVSIDTNHNITGFELIGTGTSLGTFSLKNADIVMSTGGSIYGGKSSYADTTAGFFLGYSSGYKFNIGNSTNSLNWDGSNLTVTGAINATSGSISGNLLVGGTVTAAKIVDHSITGTKIATDNTGVNTINIVDNAVTTFVTGYTDSTITGTYGTWTTFQTQTIVVVGTSLVTLQIQANLFAGYVSDYDGNGNPAHTYHRVLYYNGSSYIYLIPDYTQFNGIFNGIFTYSSMLFLPAGTYTFYWQCNRDAATACNIYASKILMNIINTKK